MTKTEETPSLAFRKYGLLVPIFITIFLEFLKVFHYFNHSWFWVLSPIWIWFGGIFQLFLAGFIYEIQKQIIDKKWN